MSNLMYKFMALFKTTKLKRGRRKSTGQSLVEFAIALPIILWLFTGVIEFGFALNYYLTMLDATRYAARWGSANGLPFVDGYGSATNVPFYQTMTGLVVRYLDPQIENPAYEGRRFPLDPTMDDVVITVWGSAGGSVTAFPTEGPYRLYGNATPIFGEDVQQEHIEDRLVSGSPNEGILVVEVHYYYNQVLGLPWLAPLDPMLLRAYTIMPLSPAEPPP